MKILTKQKSFTLIEMLVVIFILVLLISIVVVVFQRGNYEMKKNDQQRKKDVADLATAIEAFKADHGHYPFVNWGSGQHAYEIIYPEDIDKPDRTPDNKLLDQCNGTIKDATDASLYTFVLSTQPSFYPGSEVRFDDQNRACDDLSLQLLGKAYLSKMPLNESSLAEWVTDPTDPRLKRYIDEIPVDPVTDIAYKTVCYQNCPAWAKTSADYDNIDGKEYSYRYFYNSYYQCTPEAVNVGDRYWMNAITQLRENGDLDATTGLYFYEMGTANYFRHPRSSCQ